MVKRRRGARSAGARPRPARHQRFESLVELALASIPQPFASALDQVAIVVDDEPTPEQRRENGLDDDEMLYGLYEGVARTEWGADWAPVPNRIILFRLPLEADFPEPEDLADEVCATVVHELAHHLGIDDSRLEELGID